MWPPETTRRQRRRRASDDDIGRSGRTLSGKRAGLCSFAARGITSVIVSFWSLRNQTRQQVPRFIEDTHILGRFVETLETRKSRIRDRCRASGCLASGGAIPGFWAGQSMAEVDTGATCYSWPAPSPSLRTQVPGGAALPPACRDRRLQVLHRRRQCCPVRRPAATLALVQPIARRGVPTLAVAPPAGRDLVLDPGRAALHPRDEMVGGGLHESGECSPAPHAALAVPDQHRSQPLRAVGPAAGICHPTIVLDRPAVSS